MAHVYKSGIEYEGLDFTKEEIEKGDYEECKFVQCVFSKCDLSDINFVQCEFYHCDFSMANLDQTSFQRVSLDGCKLVGVKFEKCNSFLFAISFKDCILDYASFYQIDLRKSRFVDCQCLESDFSGANLGTVVLDGCDLTKATFEGCDLQGADFTTSFNYSIDPDQNSMRGAKFSTQGLRGLLEKYQIEIGV